MRIEAPNVGHYRWLFLLRFAMCPICGYVDDLGEQIDIKHNEEAVMAEIHDALQAFLQINEPAEAGDELSGKVIDRLRGLGYID